MMAVGFSVLALAAITLLAFSSSDASIATEMDSDSTAYTGSTVRSQLDDDAAPQDGAAADSAASDPPVQTADQVLPPALKDFVPHVDKIKFPTSWSAIRKTFGIHLDWAFFIAFLGLLTWAYVRYVRPKLPKVEGEETLVLNENDLTASLHLGPGEEIFFSDCETGKDGSIGFIHWFGANNRVSKIAVTNRRVVAQFKEATFCGTCQVRVRIQMTYLYNPLKSWFFSSVRRRNAGRLKTSQKSVLFLENSMDSPFLSSGRQHMRISSLLSCSTCLVDL
jgi:hypothetical protein